MNNCDKIVGVLCIGIIISVVICFTKTTRGGFDPRDFDNIGPRKEVHPLKGFNPQIFQKSPFKQSWNLPKKQTFPLIGFNQNGVTLSTMPPYIPTPREYFNKPLKGAAAVLPRDISTVQNALSQGDWAIANKQVRIPTGKLNNILYNSWGSENLTPSYKKPSYQIKSSTNLDSPSFQCGNFLPYQGGLQRAKDVCANTPGCFGFITDKNHNPVCLKSRTEQQRYYKDSKVNFYEKMI